jgi:hypothetical protein
MVRRGWTEQFERIEQIRDRITLDQGDLLDQRSLVDTRGAAGRDLQPCRDELRRGLLDAADADGGVHGSRRVRGSRGQRRREVVDLGEADPLEQRPQQGAIPNVAAEQLEVFAQMLDVLEPVAERAVHQAVDLVAAVEQELGQVAG